MATQRTAAPLSEFAKFAHLGAAIIGRIARMDTNRNGDFVELEPAAFRGDASQPFTRYGALSVGLTTDLGAKIGKQDEGKIVLVVFVGTRPTAQDPMKLFNVWELTSDEAKAIVLDGAALSPEWTAAPAPDKGKALAATPVEPLF